MHARDGWTAKRKRQGWDRAWVYVVGTAVVALAALAVACG